MISRVVGYNFIRKISIFYCTGIWTASGQIQNRIGSDMEICIFTDVHLPNTAWQQADTLTKKDSFRDILVRIRIRGSVPLTNGSGLNSGSDSFLQWCKIFFSHFFVVYLPAGTLSSVLKIYFWLKFGFNILFSKHYFSLLNTFMRKREPDPDPDPYLWPVLRIRIQIRIHQIHKFLGLLDPDTDPYSEV